MSANSQIAAIQMLRRQIPGFTEADYRAHLQEVYGVRSCTQLTFTQAAGLIGELAKMAPKASFAAKRGFADLRRGGAERVDGQYARPLQALWIAAWNLGVVDKRDDRALLAFVERQTGLSHTRFLHDAVDARKAIEGLKAWIAREGGVAWPKHRSTLARKLAVLDAQTAIVRKTLPTFDPETLGRLQGYGASRDAWDEPMLDRLSADIGKIIRRDRKTTKRSAA